MPYALEVPGMAWYLLSPVMKIYLIQPIPVKTSMNVS